MPDLNLLVENNKDIDVYVDGDTLRTNPFAKGFLIGLDKTIYTLSRMTIPEGLAQSKLFRTGIDVKKKGEK